MFFWHEGEHQKAHSRARFCARRKTLKTTSAQNTKKSFFWLLQLLDEGLTRLWQLEGTCLRTLRAYTGWWYIYKVECLHRICFFFQPSGCYVTKKTRGKANIIEIRMLPDRNLFRRFRDVNDLTPMRARTLAKAHDLGLCRHTLCGPLFRRFRDVNKLCLES